MTENTFNPNYAATIVRLNQFVDLPNCNNVKAALIFGNSVIVNKQQQVDDIGIFFPVEDQLNDKFLANNNLYRHVEWGNIDATKTGFFDQSGRVKAVRFRGHKSEGFWIPINSLDFLGININDLEVGFVFVKIGDVEICRKYVVTNGSASLRNPNCKATSLKNRIVDGQFKFHDDTENLRKNIHKLFPEDVIAISDKWHGTSAIFGKPLVNRKLSLVEKLLKKIGVAIQDSQYSLIYSSRSTIKGIDKTGDDVWGVVASEIKDKIPTGYTVYGEIVGYNPSGSVIQKAANGIAYHYGCNIGEHKFVVYRVKTVNSQGKTLELSWPQMREFTSRYGLEMVQELYYGRISDLFPIKTNLYMTIENEEDRLKLWQTNLLKFLDMEYVDDRMCNFNNREIPAEGVVVRKDSLMECEAWKLKNFKFLEDETKKNDAGISDMETEESINVTN